MPYISRYLDSPSHIEVAYFGALSSTELENSAKEILDLMSRHETELLITDCSDLTGGHSIFDLYFIANWVETHAPRIREAVIFPSLSLSSENVQFWETTCRNRGIQVRVFNDRQHAEAWLFQSSINSSIA